MSAAGVAVSRFPPSFDGNPWSYGFALFGLTLVSAMALTILIGLLLEPRLRREIDARLDNQIPRPVPRDWLAPLSLYRMILVGFLLTIVMGAAPNVLLLLAWGEASAATIDVLFLIDRLCDGGLAVPFLGTCFLILWAGQAVEHRLALPAVSIRSSPPWKLVRQRLKLAPVVLLLAIGVTFAKSVA